MFYTFSDLLILFDIVIDVHTSSLIVQTKFSKIFGVKERNDVVLKIVYQETLLKKEKQVLEKLKGFAGIIQLLEQSSYALLLSPRAAYSFIHSGLPVCKLAPVVDLLRCCHQQEIVHRDVRLSNILV